MSFWRVLVVVPVVFITGCGWMYGDNGLIRDTSKDYENAKQQAPIKLPEGYQSTRVRDAFPIPDVAAQSGGAIDTTPPLQILAVAQGLRVNRATDYPSVYWVGNLSALKQHFTEFLSSKNMSGKESTNGLLTDWLITDNEAWWRTVFGTDLPEKIRDRFLVTLGKGETPNEVAISVQHADQYIRVYGEDEWQSVATDNRVATMFLNEFVGYLDYLERLDNARRLSKLNRGISVTLGQNTEKNAALVAGSEWQTVWLKSPKVLKPLGFVLSDKDLSTGTYFFDFEPNEAGFFASILGDDEAVELSLEPGAYQVIIGGKDSGNVTVSIIDTNGQPLTDAKMAQVFPYLSEAYGRNTAKKRRR